MFCLGTSKLLFGSSIESESWEVGGWRTDWWALGDLSRGRGIQLSFKEWTGKQAISLEVAPQGEGKREEATPSK